MTAAPRCSRSTANSASCCVCTELPHADLVILMQDHRGYDLDHVTRQAPLLLDTRGRTWGPNVQVL